MQGHHGFLSHAVTHKSFWAIQTFEAASNWMYDR